MGLFGFFALILVSVYWVNRAVSLFDKLIGDGQTAWVVMEFTALTLPNVIRLVLPVAAFAATIYAVTRLSSDSELVVMQASGASPWRLSRPVVVFGLIVSVMMAVLVNVLVPVSRAQLTERQTEISENLTARFLTDGSFQHPVDGVTIYIREISDHGELMDMFMSDARDPTQQTIYTAAKALIVRSDTGPKLVMFDGMAQTMRVSDHSLAVTHFTDFTYDINSLMGSSDENKTDWDEVPSWKLISPSADLLAATGSTASAARLELNARIAQPLLAPVAALLGFAALMLGGFSRFGMGRQIGFAVLGLILLQFLSNAADSAMHGRPSLWFLAYVPALAGVAAASCLLMLSARAKRPVGGAS